ncbi:hypothetical protein CEE37_13650 [candidate division LCP-89 bacterium B3_LCP]|uniref:Sulfatase N-terminal domain-containing protein n=1 Tax=candidate division LCP-89 bacterium B3_LCP TaxID=2012998 RepID=A0A532URH9_UNCL8|nr:MAG: hypothetical protein CEE37_13650 [candidate division LCP-89 bacterium B3_LCP]
MAVWIFTSLLAGSALTAIEFIYIILTCGPFWLTPILFLQTWLIYIVASFAGLSLFELTFRIIPPFKRFVDSPTNKFKFFTIFGSITSSILLFALVVNDLDSGPSYWYLAIVAVLVCSFITWRMLRKTTSVFSIPRRSLSYSVTVLLIMVLVWFTSDWYFGSKVQGRSRSFRGNIPNLCLIVLDTTRGDHLSCYGYPHPTSPNIDKIASEGLLCQRAYSVSNWTPPGHIGIFTGTYPSQHGNDGQPFMPDDLLSMAELLSSEGYYCAALYNNPLAGKNVNITQGFDLDIGVFRHSWVYPAWHRLQSKLFYRDTGARVTFPMALHTARWIERKGGHLFLFLNLVEPHADYVIREPYFSQVSSDLNIDQIPNLQEVQSLCAYVEKVIYDSSKFTEYSQSSYRYLEAAYDSEIAYMDHHLGKFNDGMMKSGLLDKTLTVITADHGEFLGEHFTRGHPDILYNPVLKVPLIMRYPKAINPAVVDAYTSNVDVFPTVLSLMGYVNLIPTNVQGLDILSDDFPADRTILSERITECEGCFALVEGSHKLILNRDPELLEKFPFDSLLINLDVDPDEMEDIHLEEPELTHRMGTSLDEWVTSIQVKPDQQIELSPETIANLRALGYVQ